MPDWLTSTSLGEGPIPIQTLTARLLAALVLGAGVAWIYQQSHGRERTSSTLVTTLILLAVLIAMVSMTIGNNVARAFSLVGALSIVRFRTVVDDTRDTAFVIFAVIVGMAVGSGLFLVPMAGLPVVGLAAIGLSRTQSRHNGNGRIPCRLKIRLALGRNPTETLNPVLESYLDETGLIDVSTARQGAALDLIYMGKLQSQSTMAAFVAELNRIEGVMGVELSRVDP